MNSHHLHWKGPNSPFLFEQEQTTTYSGLVKALTTLTTLVALILGYYALSFFDAWPSTIKRSLYDFTIYLIPSRVIYTLQLVMARYDHLPDGAPRFRKADFGNQYAKAEAVHRMLGQTPLPTVLRKARSLSGLETIIPQHKEPGPPGLGNWDNSCYQNSVLQGLASLPAFLDYVEKDLQLCDEMDVPAPTHRALSLFLAQLGDISRRQTTIWTPTVLKSMDSWNQQDAQEYFSRIVEIIEKEAMKCSVALKRTLSSGLESLVQKKRAVDSEPVGILDRLSLEDASAEDKTTGSELPSTPKIGPQSISTVAKRGGALSLPKSPIDGTQAQALKCQACGFSEGATLTPFSCLTLNLGLRGPSYLEDLLDDYTEPEIVEDVECTECTKAVADGRDDKLGTFQDDDDRDQPSPSKRPKLKPVLRDKAKQITVCRLPKDLVLHINRSIFNDWGEQRKNASPISFPARLPFFSKWCMPLTEDEAEDPAEAVYELQCVVMHHGRHENGHYVAFARRGKEWYCFNDEIVTRVNEADVLSRGNVFMLFYEAIEETPMNAPTAEFSRVTNIEQAAETEHNTHHQESSGSSSDADVVQEPVPLAPVPPVPTLRTASGSLRHVESGSIPTTPPVPAV